MWTSPFHSEILAKLVDISRLGWACSVCACSSQNLRWWPHFSGLWLVCDLCLNSRRMRRLSCPCPHCRTVCHCSRPSCRRHARLLPGHCMAGAHLPGGGAEESRQQRTVNCLSPFRGAIWACGGRHWSAKGGVVLGPLLTLPRVACWLRAAAGALRFHAPREWEQRDAQPAPGCRP